MVGGKSRDDAGAELVRLRMRQLQRGRLLQMVVQQPGVVDQGLQNQRLAAGDRAALAAHDRARRKLRAHHLVGLAVDGLAAGGPLASLASSAAGLESARRPGGERAARGKTPACFAAEFARAAAIIASGIAAAAALRR